MFTNNSISNSDSSTIINNDNFYNNSCSVHRFCVGNCIKDLIDRHAEIVIVTEHLCIPCPRLYADIFKTVLIVCKDSSHKDDKYTDDCKTNRIIQQLLAREKSNGL
jgi:hypothetical protein